MSVNFPLRIAALILLLSLTFISRGQDTVLLFHPTAYNLEVIQKLVDQELFPLEAYHVMGVYHPGESYDYSEAEAYIAQHKDFPFSLRELKGELGPENIFRENPATEQFRELFECSEGALFIDRKSVV